MVNVVLHLNFEPLQTIGTVLIFARAGHPLLSFSSYPALHEMSWGAWISSLEARSNDHQPVSSGYSHFSIEYILEQAICIKAAELVCTLR